MAGFFKKKKIIIFRASKTLELVPLSLLVLRFKKRKKGEHFFFLVVLVCVCVGRREHLTRWIDVIRSPLATPRNSLSPPRITNSTLDM